MKNYLHFCIPHRLKTAIYLWFGWNNPPNRRSGQIASFTWSPLPQCFRQYKARQKPSQFRCSLGAATQTKQEVRVTGQITGLKSQVLFYNKWPHSLLPQPLPNQAITVVTQGNCQKLRLLWDAAGSSDWGQFKRSACHFQGRVPVTFGKKFHVPWLPIKVLFVPVCFAQRYLKRTWCWAFRI